MKKPWKYLMPLIVLVATTLVLARYAFKYKSFEGRIIGVGNESYWAKDGIGSSFPFPIELPYRVKRISVRTKKNMILDLAVYDFNLNEASVGKFVKGSYKPGKLLQIKGRNVIFGFMDLPGPEIGLNGEPAGVIKKYRFVH